MPLIITLKPGPHKTTWPDATSQPETFHSVPRLVKIIEDAEWVQGFVAQLGGLEAIIESVEWVEE